MVAKMDESEDVEVAEKTDEKSNIDPDLLASFWKAAESNSSIRFQGVQKILTILTSKQESLKKNEISLDLEYSVKRAVKGLPSTREGARQGFTVLLTEILKLFPAVKLNHVIELIEKHLTLVGTKGERGSIVIGRTLALGAIVRSKRLQNDLPTLSTVVKGLFSLSFQRSYIKIAVCMLVRELLEQVADVSFESILPAFENELKQGWESASPEILWLALLCYKTFKKQTHSFMNKHWGSNHIVTEKNFSKMAPFLKQSMCVHPMVHPLCDLIVEHCFKRNIILNLWEDLVGATLLMPNQFEGAYLSFQIMKIILPKVESIEIKRVLSKKLLDVLIKSLKAKTHPLHSASQQICDWLMNFIKQSENADIQIEVIKSLITLPGTVLFDTVTKTKYLKIAISNLNPEATERFGALMIDILHHSEVSDESLQNSWRCFAAKQLGFLVSGPKTANKWKTDNLLFLFVCGFFNVTKKTNLVIGCNKKMVNMPPSVREACRQTFLLGIEFYMRPKDKEGYKSRLAYNFENLGLLTEGINNILNAPEIFSPIENISNAKTCWVSLSSLISKLDKHIKKENKVEESTMFKTLFIHLGLLLFYGNAENQTLDPELLDELKECAKRALAKDSISSKDDLPWVEVLTGIFLSLMSDNSHFLRKVVDCTFPLLCPFLTEKALQQILDVFELEKSNDIFEEEPTEDSENDENVEFESPSASDDENEDDDDDEEDEKMGATEELRAKLQKALGAPEEVESTDEETYLSDSDMFQLDGAISEAFKEHIKKPNEAQAKENILLSFRLRVLDLLIKLFKFRPPLKMVLQCVEPLIATYEQAVKSKNQSALANKLITVLNILVGYHKGNFNELLNSTQEDIKELLENILIKIRKTTDVQHSRLLGNFCVFLIRCSKKIGGNQQDEKKRKDIWYYPLCKSLLEDFLSHGTSQINPQFFNELLRFHQDFGAYFLPTLVELGFHQDVRLFKKTQAFTLLATSAKAASIETALKSKDWEEICSLLIPKVTSALEKLLEKDLKSAHTLQLLSALDAVLNANVKQDKLEEIVSKKHPELKDVLDKIQKTKFGKKYRKMINSLKNHANMDINNNNADSTQKSSKIQKKAEKNKRKINDSKPDSTQKGLKRQKKTEKNKTENNESKPDSGEKPDSTQKSSKRLKKSEKNRNRKRQRKESIGDKQINE